MSTSKRLRAPLVVMFGVLTAVVTFAGPASAADSVYPPSAGTGVLGASARRIDGIGGARGAGERHHGRQNAEHHDKRRAKTLAG